MFAIERRQIIVDIIAETHSISVSELSRRLGVTVVTIRKDLEILESEGLVTRTYGGVILGRGPKPLDGIPDPEATATYSPMIIEAAKMITPGQTIMMGRGKFVAELADYIKNYENLTVITISVEVAMNLLKATSIDVILTGGILRPRTMTMLGHLAERVIKEISFDLSFSEADGIHPSAGVTSANIVEASTETIILEACNYPVVFAEGSAIGKIASTPITGLKENMTVIVSGTPDEAIVHQLAKRGVNVIIAESRPAAGGAERVD